MILTVDGPSGTGKSTVSKRVALLAGLPHLDTGAFYRAATLAALRSGCDLGDADAIDRVLSGSEFDQREGVMFLDNEDVSAEIRGESVTLAVSEVSAHAAIRDRLVGLQREWVDSVGGAAVVEGRDIGSVVFPDADIKVYLDASPVERARRRAIQSGDNLDETIADLDRRDRADSTRATSPLSVPEGAIVIDTTDLSFEEVVQRIIDLMEQS